jgi:hypothetical protein
VDGLTPPELAVMSAKRRKAGMLTDQYVLGRIGRYRPPAVLVGRHEYKRGFYQSLGDLGYGKVLERGEISRCLRAG